MCFNYNKKKVKDIYLAGLANNRTLSRTKAMMTKLVPMRPINLKKDSPVTQIKSPINIATTTPEEKLK